MKTALKHTFIEGNANKYEQAQVFMLIAIIVVAIGLVAHFGFGVQFHV